MKPLSYYVAQLPDTLKEVTYRVHILGEDVEEVAKKLYIPEKAAKMLSGVGWYRAMDAKMLDDLIEQEGKGDADYK